MPKFWLSQAPTVLLESLGHLDGTLRTIGEMARPGFYPPVRRLEKRNEHDRNPREIDAGELAQLTRTIVMEGHKDKFAHSVVFIHYDGQSRVQTNVHVKMANAECFLSSYLRADDHIEIIDEPRVDHLCDLETTSLPDISFKSPAAAGRVFWQCCKRELALAVMSPLGGVKLTGKPRGGKDREIIPKELLECEIIDVFDEQQLIVHEREPTLRVDWFNNQLAYNRQIWTNVRVIASKPIFPGERARRRARVGACIELIANSIDYAPTFAHCRSIVSNLKLSEFVKSWRVVKRRGRQSPPRSKEARPGKSATIGEPP